MMTVDYLNIDGQKQQKLLKGLFCLVFLVAAGFAGCKSESNRVAVAPVQGDITRPTEKVQSEGTATKQTEQVTGTGADTDADSEKVSAMAETSFAASETACQESKHLSDVAAVGEQDILAAGEKGVYSIAEIASADDKLIANSEQPLSVTPVNLPALNNPGMADELISVNFDQVDIRTVLKTIGDITGINFVVDENVRGTITVMSPTKVRLGEVYNVLESILEVLGYAAVPSGGFVKIVPRVEATKSNIEVRVGSDPSLIPQNDSIVTQIIPLRYANAADISQIVQPLLGAGAQMSMYPTTNSIVITDTSASIHRIAKIIQKLDVAGLKEQVTVIGLKYASAQVLSEQIAGIMEKAKDSSAQAARTRNLIRGEAGLKIIPDVRTNSIIVVANARDTEAIRGLVKQLDVQRPTGANNVHVVYLKNAQSKEVAQSLTAALANLKIAGAIEGTQLVQVTADEGTNALIIAASAQDFEVIAGIVEKLDIVREQVLVEMLIVEVSEETLKEIGIDWATLDQSVEGSVRFFGATGFGPRVDFAEGDLEGLAVGAWRGSGSNIRIGPVLHALEKRSGVNILSTPHILTSNHHKAKIIVGENRAFVMQSRITEDVDPVTPTVIKTYEYKDVGISLEITPHISQGGLIRLEINSEFTKLIEDVMTPSVDTPTTAKRQAQTVVSMNTDSTVIIGGLIRDDKVTVEKKIPFVSDIPVVGDLFKFRKDQLQKTNLLIFITPHVMANQKELEQITEEKKKQMRTTPQGLEENNSKN